MEGKRLKASVRSNIEFVTRISCISCQASLTFLGDIFSSVLDGLGDTNHRHAIQHDPRVASQRR